MEVRWCELWPVLCGVFLSGLRCVSGSCSFKGDTSLVATHLTATSTPQNLTYPGGVGNYSALTECLWTVNAAGDTVMLEVLMLDMEVDYSSCSYDYLKIYDGTINGKVERTLCGTLENDIPTYYACLISSTSTALVRFQSDNYVSGGGFTLRYSIASQNGCASYQTQTSNSDDDGGLSTLHIVLIVLGVILGIILIILLIILICWCCKKKDNSKDRVTPLMEDTDSMKNEKMASEHHYAYTENVDETTEKTALDENKTDNTEKNNSNKTDSKEEKKKKNNKDKKENKKNKKDKKDKSQNEKTKETPEKKNADDKDNTREDEKDENKHGKQEEGVGQGKKERVDPTSREAVAALVLHQPEGKPKKLPPIDKKDNVPMKQKASSNHDKNKNNGMPPVDTPDKQRSMRDPCSTPPLSHKENSSSRSSEPRKPLRDTNIFWTNLTGQNRYPDN